MDYHGLSIFIQELRKFGKIVFFKKKEGDNLPFFI